MEMVSVSLLECPKQISSREHQRLSGSHVYEENDPLKLIRERAGESQRRPSVLDFP
jgi:hypothetical protein